jgi:hypothetical protein
MRLMARAAAFPSNRLMFERERAAFIAMAIQATGLIGGEALLHRGPDGTVRIVTIHATHGVFRHFVVVRLLELRPNIQVTTGACSVNRRRAVRYDAHGSIGMDLVASGAGYLIPGVAALQSAHLRRLIQVTTHTDPVGRGRRQLGGLPDIRGGCGFRMLLRGPVAGFAGAARKAAALVRIQLSMRALLECVEDILMAGAAGRGPGVWRRRWRWLWRYRYRWRSLAGK